ncbi:hypothetical protein GSY69_03415 [Brevibacterium sp. 5221]|uniref:Glycosyltransferase RgtA/B/C/D-like domain-containing protein n=1 Tax=Brevibacterium rongguiense TaxID=2695267 RepID=A0A6N9H4Q7_9MICO|nr:hypothetical protein [Brevibacterium rongguiense]MYM19047.1 hypothetical protein [Brevibacterium rongguiense]
MTTHDRPRQFLPGRWAAALWVLVLAACGWAGAQFIIEAFYPGGFNDDMVFQLRQAQGQIPFNDWHPVIQALLWRWLMQTTGAVGSLLVCQVIVFSAAAFGLALHIFLTTGRRLVSLLGFLPLLAPWCLNFAGLVWKDTGMTACLFAAVVLALHMARLRGRWLPVRLPLLILAVVFLVYATLVRKNAAFAILPVLWFVWCQAAAGTRLALFAGSLLWKPWRRLRGVPKRRFAGLLAVTIVFAGLVAGGAEAADAAARPQHTGQLTQIYLDDLSFTLTDEQIATEPMPERLRADLRGIRSLCPLDGSKQISNVYWRCYRGDDPNLTFAPIDDADAIQDLWIRQTTAHPVEYLRYRTLVYAHFLFNTNYKFDAPVSELPPGLEKANPIQNQIMLTYVTKFGIGALGWTFQVWFWLAAAIAGCALSRRLHRFRRVAICLSASSLIYLLGYVPIVPAPNLRYAYWPAIAMTTVAVMALAARRRGPAAPRPQAAADDSRGEPTCAPTGAPAEAADAGDSDTADGEEPAVREAVESAAPSTTDSVVSGPAPAGEGDEGSTTGGTRVRGAAPVSAEPRSDPAGEPTGEPSAAMEASVGTERGAHSGRFALRPRRRR